MIYVLLNILFSSVYFAFNNLLCCSSIVLFGSLLISFGNLLLFCQNFKLFWQGWFTFLLAINCRLAWLGQLPPELLVNFLHCNFIAPSHAQSSVPCTNHTLPYYCSIWRSLLLHWAPQWLLESRLPPTPTLNSVNNYLLKVSAYKTFVDQERRIITDGYFFLKHLVVFNSEYYFPCNIILKIIWNMLYESELC